ncbi:MULTISPECIES: ABC transporter substrate-binding protein [Pseudomonas]|uniref:ABC transporter substrate-binding protein n=1 Tax=Pseudomonas TaxID=286 RepID=UPI000C9CE796|nr:MULTISPECIES: ABC transporter substrate-binding protein [Pseudomonas]AXK56965.1 amino acid ABC transporter substrate-binding protein [Pseudomonas protegens]PNG29965.1 amino acid ABC transporter substrate-binding protein [Pseudomonas protegens]
MLTRTLKGLLAASTVAAAALLSPAAAQADDLQSIQASKEIRIAMSGQYSPFSFANEQNQIVGFDASISEALAQRLGVKVSIVTTPFDGIIAGLLAKKYDAIIASMTITPERQKAVDFVGPYYHAGRTIVVKEDSPIHSLDDLKDVKVGVTLGDAHDKWARARGNLKVKTYKGLPEMLVDLDAGRLDALVMDSVPVLVAVKETGQKVRIITPPDSDGGVEGMGIALRKNNPELKAAMQQALNDMLADGSYEKISMQWIGKDIR